RDFEYVSNKHKQRKSLDLIHFPFLLNLQPNRPLIETGGVSIYRSKQRRTVFSNVNVCIYYFKGVYRVI
ncbi:hypothetical protein KSS87_001256, partial [Heliosperma pusillum]